MFETAVIQEARGRTATGFSTSLILQGMILSGAVVASLYVPVDLPELPEVAPPMRLLPMPRAVRVVATILERSAPPAPAPDRLIWRPPTTRAVASSAPPTMDLGELPIPTGAISTGPALFSPVGTSTDALAQIRTAPPPAKPPAQPTPEPARLPIGGDVLASKLIHRVQPIYPDIARRARIEGVVKLHGVITRDGRIASLQVISGHPLLQKAALDAVSQWVYSPTLLNQKPVEVEAPIEVRFILGR